MDPCFALYKRGVNPIVFMLSIFAPATIKIFKASARELQKNRYIITEWSGTFNGR
jgi:hypothetical protein